MTESNNGNNGDTPLLDVTIPPILEELKPKRVFFISFPFIKLSVHSFTENIHVVSLNENIFIVQGNEDEAKLKAAELLIAGFELLKNSITTFFHEQAEQFEQEQINQEQIGESDATPKIS